MGTVSIGGTTYTIYGEHTGVGSADEYLGVALHLRAVWDAAGPDDQKSALVTATRMLERQTWQGEKTDDGQALAWPRTNVMDRYGDAISSVSIPQDVITASYELAGSLLSDADGAQTQLTASENIKRIKAGPVEIEKFRGVSAGRFSTIVQELVGQYLSSNMSVAVPTLNGSDSDASAFDTEDFFDFSDPI